MNYFDEDEDVQPEHRRSARKVGLPMGPSAPHYPNKAERKKLAQICQKSGLTEDEVRAIKKHRVELALARSSMSKGNGHQNRLRYEIKIQRRLIAYRLNVQVWDPLVTVEMNKTNWRAFYA